MRAQPLAAALFGIFVPALAFASDTEWRRYVIPSTGTSVDVAGLDITGDAGAPEGGTGRRFFTEDRRADLTVQSAPNPKKCLPATFLAKKRSARGHHLHAKHI